MTKFEKLTQSIESLAEYLSIENKGDNKGCQGCDLFEECTGKETCKNGWINFFSSEQDIADKFGVTKTCISDLERGKKTPSYKLLVKL